MTAPRHPLSGSLRALGATVIGILRTRLELLAVELAEEKNRLLTILLWALGGLLALAMGILMLSLLVVAAFWDTPNRLTALGVVAALYFLTGVGALLFVRKKVADAPFTFDETLAELERDRQALGAAADAPTPARRGHP
ncbi:hypothetical protein FXN63_04750 [Pigmentiphaga aceris]|uniref:Phage holin family protein n=1 Tax=Pigmentiphaga aceris TaxID=1940612 RepID=A0A5C0AWY5_9BURK|nr:phage holin family protein [Pigmentiphaga aceris]QEI05221.1 hypothetical protein FXN63_04750 [Pigmentiphaga aceris]